MSDVDVWQALKEAADARPKTFDEPLWIRIAPWPKGASVDFSSIAAWNRASEAWVEYNEQGRSPFMATDAPPLEIVADAWDEAEL